MNGFSIGWVVVLAGMALLFYVLYINGYMVMQSKRALMYVGTDRGKKASFTSCSGYTKRVVKFEEDRIYHFNLKLELTKGDVQVEILDSGKQCLLSLDQNTTEGNITAEKGKRFFLVVRFGAASGNYAVDWK